MLALYRCGRQAEALENFRQTRQKLIDELGVEPGVALRELHEAILRQDATLELPTPASDSAGGGAATNPLLHRTSQPLSRFHPRAATVTRNSQSRPMHRVRCGRHGRSSQSCSPT